MILLSVAPAKAISRRLIFLALGLLLLITLNELSKLGIDLTAPKLQGWSENPARTRRGPLPGNATRETVTVERDELRAQIRNLVAEGSDQLLLCPLAYVRRADGIHRPVITLPVRDEGSDADDRVVDVLREFFAHRLAACCERLLRPPFKMGIYTAFWNGATVIDCILWCDAKRAMKILSIRQPWAYLITRGYPTGAAVVIL